MDRDSSVSCLLPCFRSAVNPSLPPYLKLKGYQLTMTEAELNGPERFAVDGVIDEETCQALIKLANVSPPTACWHFHLYMP